MLSIFFPLVYISFIQIKLYLCFVICVCLFCRFCFWQDLVFKKFPSRFFNVKKLSMMFASLACLIPSLFIFAAACLSVFLYFDAIASSKMFEYSSLLQLIFFLYDRISFNSLASSLEFIIYFWGSKVS